MTGRLLLVLTLLAATPSCGGDDDGTDVDGGSCLPLGAACTDTGTPCCSPDGCAGGMCAPSTGDGGATDGGATDGGATDGGMELVPQDPPSHITVQTPTFHSVGLVWEVDGDDTDHDAVLSVRYRKAGDEFSDGADLVRVDWRPYYHGTWYEALDRFAGSLMFLTPCERYQIELTYDDPDDTDTRDGEVHTFTADTRCVPVKPTGGNIYYAVAGSGSGNAGTSDDPFEGLSEANSQVSPGDIVRLRDTAGVFDSVVLTTSGSEGNYIVYEADSGHTPIIEGSVGIDADHLWIEGLSFRWDGRGDLLTYGDYDDGTSAIYQVSSSTTDDVVITGNDITLANTALPTPAPGCTGSHLHGQHYANGVFSISDNSRWVVTDNDIVGMWIEGIGDASSTCGRGSTGKGISLGGENSPNANYGAIIAYNRLTRTTDAMGGSEATDVYGNLVFDVGGNAFSSDGGGSGGNIRIWGNLFTNTPGRSLSWQPQSGAPWYWLYNQVSDQRNTAFKFRVPDRSVMIGNTFDSGTLNGWHFMRFIMRNNLHIHGSSPVWNSVDNDGGCTPPDCIVRADEFYEAQWFTDLDYDGFDRGGSGAFFRWYNNTTNYSDFASFFAATGIYEHGVEVDRNEIFTNFTSGDETVVFELSSGANAAVDAGQEVPNLADFYLGSAPDLGAHERGTDAMHVGPRDTSVALDQRVNHWTRH